MLTHGGSGGRSAICEARGAGGFACVAGAFPLTDTSSLRELAVVPGDAAVQGIHYVFRLPQTMAFPGITKHDGFDSDVAKRYVELFGLGDRDVVVVFTVNEQHGSLHFV